MRKLKYTFVIALMFLVSFVKSQNTGPVSPEAVAFEPVDVTDMVNLVTGDFTYVIPLLTVPSPEGGYPIGLSYHGGIAMDQEASWVGLGWNVNPGAINRKINGVPDDWLDKARTSVVSMDGGSYEVYSIGVGVSLGSKAILSLGVAYSWGDYKGFDGEIGLGYQITDNFRLGAEYSTRTGLGINGGYGLDAYGNNSIGFSINESGVGIGITNRSNSSISIGQSFNSEQMNGSVRIGGIGKSFSTHDAPNSDGMKVTESNISLSVPVWIFYLSYNHYSVDYQYFNKYKDRYYGSLYTVDARDQMDNDDDSRAFYSGVQDKQIKMDSYIIPVDYNSYSEQKSRDASENNHLFAAYDNYIASAQGLSGQFSLKLFSETLLTHDSYFFDPSKSIEVVYHYWASIMNNTTNVYPNFYFDNEFSGYLVEDPGTFVLNGTDDWSNLDYINESRNTQLTIDSMVYNGYSNNRKVSGNYIEWFTNNEIIAGTAKLKGFIENEKISSNRNNEVLGFDPTGIGGFKITALDGKTYHYSLPVYELEEFIRKNGDKSGDYFERYSLEEYAYTWLITAITGSDYIDKNKNGFVDNGDYGYWIKFEYGKMKDGYIWQMPYNLGSESYETYKKEIQWGRKQIYYLNSIESRTHIAYFIKGERSDGVGKSINRVNNIEKYFTAFESFPDGEWKENSTGSIWTNENDNNKYDYSVSSNFIYSISKPIKPLLLDKVILINKNNFSGIQRLSTKDYSDYGDISFNEKIIISTIYLGGIISNASSASGSFTRVPGYNADLTNIYDDLYTSNNTNVSLLENQAVKIIDFDYEYKLCQNTPNSDAANSAKLALTKLDIKGSNGSRVIPPYSFIYNALGSNSFSENNKDVWGYDKTYPENWSLKEIILPTGAKIGVEYERNDFHNEAYFGDKIEGLDGWWDANTNEIIIDLGVDMDVFSVDMQFNIEAKMLLMYIEDQNGIYGWHKEDIAGIATVKSIDKEKYQIHVSVNPLNLSSNYPSVNNGLPIDEIILTNYSNLKQKGGGVRVKTTTISDGINSFATLYNYNTPGSENTSGTIMYSIYNLENKYVPYVSELPLPKVLYKYVTVTSQSQGVSEFKTLYEFEVYKDIDINAQDFYIENQYEIENKQLPNSSFCEIPGDHAYEFFGRSSILKSNLNSIGRLKSVTLRNNLNDFLSQTEYDYFEPEETPIGLSQETYNYYKRYTMFRGDGFGGINFGKSDSKIHYNATSKITYPSILKSKRTITNGLTQETRFNKFDFYTGNVIETETELSNGKVYKTNTLPAYQAEVAVYFNDMGPKSLNSNNKNMLTQEAASLSFIKDGDIWKPIGANIQTWSKVWKYREYVDGDYTDVQEMGVWRKHKQFVWKGNMNEDGTYSSEFEKYNTTDKLKARFYEIGLVSTPNWEKVNEITRYNHYSMPLESKDINGNYAASKMDIKHERTIASAANASYGQFTFTGFENQKQGNYVEGEVKLTSTYSKIVSNYSHTGDYSLETYGLSKAFEYSIPIQDVDYKYTRPYQISFWATSSGIQSLGIDVQYNFYDASNNLLFTGAQFMSSYQKESFGGWYLFHIATPKPELVTNLSQAKKLVISIHNRLSKDYIYFDDFRLHPINAPMQSYAYDHHTGAITAILDNNNIATKYEYDDAGKLKRVYKEVPTTPTATGGFKKVSEHNYGYAMCDLGFSNLNCPPEVKELSVPVSLSIKNNGTSGSQACILYYYISEDDKLDAGDIKKGEVNVGSISSGSKGGRANLNITLPPDLSINSGYYLFFEIDADNKNRESNETNNLTYRRVNYVDNYTYASDLTITEVVCPSISKGSFDVSLTIENLNNDNAPSCWISCYINGYSDENDPDKKVMLNSLAPLSSEVVNFTFDLPVQNVNFLPDITYDLYFKIDGGSIITETDETNNIQMLNHTYVLKDIATTNVSWLPKDQIEWISAPQIIPINEEVVNTTIDHFILDLKLTFTNLGEVALEGISTYKIYLSEDTLLDVNDMNIGEGDIISFDNLGNRIPIAVMESLTFETNAQILKPIMNESQQYYLIFKADANNIWQEYDELNNMYKISVIREPSPPPAL